MLSSQLLARTMKPVYIFRHIACEGPGYLGEFLNRHHIPYRIIAIDKGDAVPADLTAMSGLVFMGGPMSVNDPLPWIAAELDLIRQARHSGLPVLGHCLGGQLIAKALGAKVYPNVVREIGWHDVAQAHVSSPWLRDLPEKFEAFHWHGETFDLPAGAELLLHSIWCRHQAFVHGAMLALQFHVEMTAGMVTEWADLYREQLAQPGDSVQSHDAMTSGAEQRAARLNTVADTLYGRWLTLVTDKAGVT